MKITMYELLGLVKDGKAPKKIKIKNDILTLSKTNIIQYNFEQCGQLSWDYYIENYRLDEKIVEILDKDFKLEEKKIPEKWNDLSFTTMRKREDSIDDDIHKLKGYIETIMRTQNEIIDYLKSKGE